MHRNVFVAIGIAVAICVSPCAAGSGELYLDGKTWKMNDESILSINLVDQAGQDSYVVFQAILNDPVGQIIFSVSLRGDMVEELAGQSFTLERPSDDQKQGNVAVLIASSDAELAESASDPFANMWESCGMTVIVESASSTEATLTVEGNLCHKRGTKFDRHVAYSRLTYDVEGRIDGDQTLRDGEATTQELQDEVKQLQGLGDLGTGAPPELPDDTYGDDYGDSDDYGDEY